MKKIEFIKMLQQDNETELEPKKTTYAQVIDCTIIALIDESPDFEIDSSVTCERLFKLITDQAFKKKGYPCVGPFEAAKLIAEHLKTENDGPTRLYNMVMGMVTGNAPVPRKNRISLEDI